MEYGDITAFQLTKNDKIVCSLYDVTQLFESWVAKVEDGLDFATAVGTPYTSEQILSIAYISMEMTGMSKDELKDWDRPCKIKN